MCILSMENLLCLSKVRKLDNDEVLAGRKCSCKDDYFAFCMQNSVDQKIFPYVHLQVQTTAKCKLTILLFQVVNALSIRK